jgi:hypothetical protein
MRQGILVLTSVALLSAVGTASWAYRDYFTPEQREKLHSIRTVRVQVIALTDQGKVDATDIEDLVVARMEDLEYRMVTDRDEPHDVVFRVKCEEYKTWEGTRRHGGDADLPDAPSRLWKGPACQLTYVLAGMKIDWQKEVRAEFEDPVAAAKAANWDDSGAFALNELRIRLTEYDFPVYVTAEWGQGGRLLKLLDRRDVDDLRKVRVISLLGEMQSDEALPRLQEALKDEKFSRQAAAAIGNLGSEGIPLLIDLLKNSKDPELQAAAAKGLGRVGGIAGDPRVVDPLLEMLDPPEGIDRRVQIEVVWALGKMPDKRSIDPLNNLFAKVLKEYNPEDMQLQELKEALNWSIKQCDVSGHIS